MTRKEREKKRQKCRRKYLKSDSYFPYVQEVFMWNLGCAILQAMEDPEFMEGYRKWQEDRQRKQEEESYE